MLYLQLHIIFKQYGYASNEMKLFYFTPSGSLEMAGIFVDWVSLAFENVRNIDWLAFSFGIDKHLLDVNGIHKIFFASVRNFLPVNP